MFTGIIENLGEVTTRDGSILAVSSKIPKPKIGASIAINGVCLTAVEVKGNVCRFDVGPDTWNRTNLGHLKVGETVNVEPSLRVGDEIGGHFVSGHVDAAAKIKFIKPWGKDFLCLRVELPNILRGLVAVKGSIAIDGISLTVTAATKDYIEVMLVPHTLQNTNLGKRKAGDRVNLESDPLARYAMAAALTLRKK
jgi:riboflavin synthase